LGLEEENVEKKWMMGSEEGRAGQGEGDASRLVTLVKGRHSCHYQQQQITGFGELDVINHHHFPCQLRQSPTC